LWRVVNIENVVGDVMANFEGWHRCHQLIPTVAKDRVVKLLLTGRFVSLQPTILIFPFASASRCLSHRSSSAPSSSGQLTAVDSFACGERDVLQLVADDDVKVRAPVAIRYGCEV
jgi:hypothetical protein